MKINLPHPWDFPTSARRDKVDTKQPISFEIGCFVFGRLCCFGCVVSLPCVKGGLVHGNRFFTHKMPFERVVVGADPYRFHCNPFPPPTPDSVGQSNGWESAYADGSVGMATRFVRTHPHIKAFGIQALSRKGLGGSRAEPLSTTAVVEITLPSLLSPIKYYFFAVDKIS